MTADVRLRVADLAAVLMTSGLATDFVRLPDTGEAFHAVRALLTIADTDVDLSSLLLARGWSVQGKYGPRSAEIADAAARRIAGHAVWTRIEDNGVKDGE